MEIFLHTVHNQLVESSAAVDTKQNAVAELNRRLENFLSNINNKFNMVQLAVAKLDKL